MPKATRTSYKSDFSTPGSENEDWVERQHQIGMRLRQRFRTVRNPLVRALAREKANSRNTHLDVIAHTDTRMRETSAILYLKKKLMLLQYIEKDSAIWGGWKRSRTRDSPGRRHYLTTRSGGRARVKPPPRKIRLIVKKNFR